MSVVLIRSSVLGDKPQGNLMENMASFITNIFKLMETTISFHKLSIWYNINFGRKPYGTHC